MAQEPPIINAPALSDTTGLQEAWPTLSPEGRRERFRQLSWPAAETFFCRLDAYDQSDLLRGLSQAEQQLWIRLLAPDDVADIIQEAPAEEQQGLLGLLGPATREQVTGLLAYAEDAAGGLMSPRFAHVRPDMTGNEALQILRMQGRGQLETISYVYVLDRQRRLLGVMSFWELFTAPAQVRMRDLMRTDVVSVTAVQDQEIVADIIAQHDLLAVPVVDETGGMQGIITVDDIVDVVHEEATEDMQKLAGMEALELPYLRTCMATMLKKRAGWLMALFLGEMLTATAMGHYEGEIARAVVLALFVPLIISSGGNAGSQASTLVIRALALGEVRLHNWWRVMRREIVTGCALGVILGLIGFIRIVAWQAFFDVYGAHVFLVALTVGMSLIGVVLWGTLAGSMLPLVLHRLGFDPASASAPFVATLVDVTGLIIYFNVASLILHRTLL